MKFAGYIMSLLVLALSCLPCADEADARNSKNIKTEISKATHADDDHEDACSPFCQCSCCAGFSFTHSIAGITSDNNYNNRSYTSFRHTELIEISLPIWQPPQLV